MAQGLAVGFASTLDEPSAADVEKLICDGLNQTLASKTSAATAALTPSMSAEVPTELVASFRCV